MRHRVRARLRAGAALTLAVALVAVPFGVQAAVPAGATGHYASSVVAGRAGAWTGNVTVATAGFPAATLTSTSSSVSRSAGTSAFLGTTTPFGQRFGSSSGQPYLSADAAGKAPSATTLRFAGPTPATGWGFTLGDIDADRVTVSATDAAGAPLTGTALADALGWQSAFNYCVNTPKPSSCTGAGPFTDVPTWDPATATLSGSGSNTFGAAGWFEPTVALGSLTFTFSVQTGSPNYQIWLAALSVPVSGHVDGASSATPGVTVDLLDDAGDPVPDAKGDSVRADVDGDGTFRLPAVTDGEYTLRVDPGDDAKVSGAGTVAVRVDTERGPVALPAGGFTIVAVAAPPSPTPTTSSAGSSQAAASSGSGTRGSASQRSTPQGSVANTGFDPALPLLGGVALVVVGAALVLTARRRLH